MNKKRSKKTRPTRRRDRVGAGPNVRPIHDRVLVRRLEEDEASRGGIIIPDTAKEKPQRAEVVAVGPGKVRDDGERTAPEVGVGDRVLIGKYGGSDIRLGEDEYVIVREDEILAVLR